MLMTVTVTKVRTATLASVKVFLIPFRIPFLFPFFYLSCVIDGIYFLSTAVKYLDLSTGLEMMFDAGKVNDTSLVYVSMP